ASSSVAPVSSGYERSLRPSLALARRTRSARDHSAMTSSIELGMQELEKIWMNGELVDWADARIHVASHGLHYGTGVFEGIRCYETAEGPAVFRLVDHLGRFENSAKLLYMALPYTVDELRPATHELVAANGRAA